MTLNYQAIVNKRIRGFILKTIKLGDPANVGDEIVGDCLAENGVFLSQGQLHAFLNYLQERGFIRMKKAGMKELSIFPQRTWNLTLTPDGQLLLEGIKDDPGVTLEGSVG